MSTQPPAWAIEAARAARRTRPHALPSVSLAQLAEESAWGAVVTGAFNFFGIKAVGAQPCRLCATHEEVGGRRVTVTQPFRVFASAQEAFDAHGDVLEQTAGCAAYRAALPDLARACDLLGHGAAGRPRYATAAAYGAQILRIIRGSDLTRYDT